MRARKLHEVHARSAPGPSAGSRGGHHAVVCAVHDERGDARAGGEG
jgi:hypothetical protein